MPETPQTAPGRILVVDDESSMRTVLAAVLSADGHEVRLTDDGHEAIALYGSGSWDLVIEDLRMPKMHGLELLKGLKQVDPSAIVIVITAYGTWDTAVEAMRLGAYDYVKKPFDNDHLRALISRAIARRRAGKHLRQEGETAAVTERLIGNDPRMLAIMDMIRRVGPTDSTILIQGESGTGKELVAWAVHAESLRAAKPLIAINCGAFTETLLESELFGHVRGSFTGAVGDKKGLIEAADEGTLFLDEVAEMTPQTQVKLLRVIESSRIRPVGGINDKLVDVRVIGATNKNLEHLISRGSFRSDLYHRLNVIPIVLPPLRERKDDIPQLAGYFMGKYASKVGKIIRSIDEDAALWLRNHDWPGNVRELENTIERSVALARSDRLTLQDVSVGASKQASQSLFTLPGIQTIINSQGGNIKVPATGMNLEDHLSEVEKEYLRQALTATGGNMTEAAKLLGMTFRAIRYKVRKYGLR